MKVLLISANTEKINMPTLPMGLGFVAAAVQQAGHEVRFVDLMGPDGQSETLESEIKSFAPEVIGISIRNIDDQVSESTRFLIEGARDVVAACKRLTDAPVVLGGAGYSMFPETALDYLGADMGIQGEGEAAFCELLERLDAHAPLDDVPGLFLRGKGLQAPRTYIRLLDDWPFPDPALFDASLFQDPMYYLPIQTRRGCPLHCSYCSTASIEGAQIRKRSPDSVVRELVRWHAAGFKRIFFVDNTFNLPQTYAKELCDRLAREQLDLTWRCILYPGQVDEPLVAAMARAGCEGASLGFESGSQRVLDGMNKRFDTSEIEQISQLLGDAGIGRMGFLLLGGPDETRETVMESLEFVDALGLELVKVTIGIRIYPYTRLADIARQEGVIAPDDDLLHPRFYLKPDLETWIRKTVADWMEKRKNWMM
jgi:radical SAM superfamily enzyme YgiQ (UPF0313 family)